MVEPVEACMMPAARPPSLVSLKRRAEFLRVRGGSRCATPLFVLEAKPREADSAAATKQARFGFTVTKRLGKAVDRNRIKRRLRAAVRDVQMHHARPGFDYVVVARLATRDTLYATLVGDMAIALERVHEAPRDRRGTRGATR
jgi:ribonuclease P protein component